MPNLDTTEEYDFWQHPGVAGRGPTQEDPQRQMLLAELIRMATTDRPQGPPVDFTPMQSDEEIRGTADRMRRGNVLGTLFAMSGDEALGKAAPMLKGDPDEYLRRQAQQRQVREYQEWQANQPHEQSRASVLGAAIKALEPDEGTNRVIPAGRLKEHEFDASQLRGTSRFYDRGDPGLTQQFGDWLKVKGLAGPVEKLSAWIARNGYSEITDPDMARQARFWAELESEIIAPWRNNLFGATLTNNEQAAFRNLAMLEPGMPWTEVQRRLNDLYEARKEGAKDRIISSVGVYGSGYGQMFKDIFGDTLNRGSGRRSWEEGEDASGQPQIEIEPAGRAQEPASANPGGAAPPISDQERVRGRKTGVVAERLPQ